MNNINRKLDSLRIGRIQHSLICDVHKKVNYTVTQDVFYLYEIMICFSKNLW